MSEIKIKLIRSLAGLTKRQLDTAKSLRLGKIDSYTIQPDNGATQGKIRQLAHILEIENIEQ